MNRRLFNITTASFPVAIAVDRIVFNLSTEEYSNSNNLSTSRYGIIDDFASSHSFGVFFSDLFYEVVEPHPVVSHTLNSCMPMNGLELRCVLFHNNTTDVVGALLLVVLQELVPCVVDETQTENKYLRCWIRTRDLVPALSPNFSPKFNTGTCNWEVVVEVIARGVTLG